MDNRKKIIIVIWVFILVGVAMGASSVYVQTQYEKVEAVITVKTSLVNTGKGHRNNKKAYVEYDYDNKHYSEIGLDYYNGFSMKTGKKYTIYINPKTPDRPHTVSYTFSIVWIGICVFFLVCLKKRKYR